MRIHRLPAATYRLQLGPQLDFNRARALLPYLQSLGITTVYVSPLLQSVRGGHGYDVTDPRRPNDALGTAEDLRRLCGSAAAAEMDIVVDIVPNHMAASLENPFWRDVIEKGRASPHADIFAIDWDAPEARGKLVLPVLHSGMDDLMAAGEVRLECSYAEGEFVLACGGLRFPVSPWSYRTILSPAVTDDELFLEQVADSGRSHDTRASEICPDALAPVLVAARTLPLSHEAACGERRRLAAATGVLKQRLREAVHTSPAAAAYVRARVAAFEPRVTSADRPGLLAALVVAQPYRLMSWRAGSRIVNYRRFFDIGDLVAVRQEVPGVFELTHGFLLELLDQPGVAGFRVDHIDGLRDPRGYLDRLRAEVGDSYIVVEKILAEDERIPESWPVDGTTGYELAADIDRLLVDGPGWALLQSAYESFSGEIVPLFRSLARASKREILSALFPQEVRALARDLPMVLTQQQRFEERRSADADAAAIVDVTAALRVYRTYFGDPSWDAHSERWLQGIADTLRVDGAHGLPDAFPTTATEDVLRTIAEAPVAERALQWTLSWQQLTGAAAAKGVEDTALYRYPVLFSRNEVGAEPDAPPIDATAFHSRMHRRHHEGPRSLNATSTHDSKRDEDARGRLHVLSERAAEWAAVLRRWHEMNAPCLHLVGGRPVPSRREENLLYQSLVALWPLRPQDEAAATERLCRYAVKALREAKLQTSWTDPAEEHEVAVESFVRSVLAPDGHGFLGDLRAFTRSIAASGAVNALAMALLRVVVPGIPDTYQGTELWTLPRLVDPDNRVAVDFSLRRRLLDELDRQEADDRTALLADLTTGWVDGRLKLYVLSRALRFRRAHESLFSSGGYVALDTRGSSAGTVFACARRRGDAWVVCLIPRLSDGLRLPGEIQTPVERWRNLTVTLPDDAPTDWTDLLTGRGVRTHERSVPVGKAFELLPVAMLASGNASAPDCGSQYGTRFRLKQE